MTDPIRRHAERAGFAYLPADLAFDAEREHPRLVRAVAERRPSVREILAGLRRRLPVARHAGEGITGQFYRLPGHHRRVCCVIPDLGGPERLGEGDIIAFEGTEPLMADFDDYLQWMMTTPARHGELPMALHLALVADVPPGAMPLDECHRAQRLAAALHERHLTLYGELAHAPVPLAVHRCSAEDTARYVEALRWRLPEPAFERAAARARPGCGVSVWYYPAAPIRVDDLQRLAATDPQLRAGPEAGEETVTGWCRQFARLLHLGFMPFAPWNRVRGSCVDAGSACIDGGFTDMSTLVPFESIPDDGWFRRCLLDSIRRLSQTVAVFKDALGGRPAAARAPDLDWLSHAFVGPRLHDQLRREAPAGAALDGRISSCFRLDRLADLVAARGEAPPPCRPYRPARPAVDPKGARQAPARQRRLG